MFREYDLRGRINENELNETSVPIIAKAYGTMLRNRDITDSVVGYDLRTGSKEFTALAIEALRSTGVNVISLGLVLTPNMYAAQHHYNTKGGMMVTASHNPNGWLGFKLALGLSYTLGPEEMKELWETAISGDFAQGEGSLREEDYMPVYTKDVLSRVNITRPVRVLVNAGNGTAGPIAPPILRQAGCEVFEFLTEKDLEYKRYFPNPSKKEMMDDTGEETVKHKAEIGFAFDGDGDRLGITDENGQIIWPDRFMALISREILKEHPGASIVYDVKSSRALAEDIAAHGGDPVLWKTGHSYIKKKLHELKSPFAGEMSGHIFFGPPIYYGFDDAIFTALKLLELLSHTDRPFSELIASVPTYISTPTLQAECPQGLDKYQIVADTTASFIEEGYKVFTFENNLRLGGRIEFEDGWGLIRASSNLEVFVMRYEATTQSKLNEIMRLIAARLQETIFIHTWESG